MGIYGYCVAPRGHAVPAVRGIGDAPLILHEVGGLAVVASSIMERPEATVAAIQRHNAVIEAAVTPEVTPVPLRFGQWAEAEAFDAVIAEKAEWYRDRLAAFAGAMEFGIRVLRPDEASPARVVRDSTAATGVEYMNALRERVAAERGGREAAGQVEAGIAEILGSWVREERIERARTPHGVITVSHLVSRDHFEKYRENAQRLRERFPDMRFLLSGPWAPYSFAT